MTDSDHSDTNRFDENENEDVGVDQEDEVANNGVINPHNKEYGLVDAYLLTTAFGWMGAHQFYLGRKKWGLFYLFTFGCFGVGWIIDLIQLPWLIKDVKTGITKRRLADVYILAIPLGILGVHHYYLGRTRWGILYTFSLGLFGIGWVVDLVRMEWLVGSSENDDTDDYRLDDAYLLVIVFGWLGFHNHYLGRPGWWCFYMFTFGLFGIGWIVDIVRMPWLVKRANAGEVRDLCLSGNKYNPRNADCLKCCF
ncbi:uncharacterized protein LOC144440032 [Glandiceps talaboti]